MYQLDPLVDTEHISDNELAISALHQEIQQKDAELLRNYTEMQRKDDEIQQLTTALHDKDVMLETLRSDMSKLQITSSCLLPEKVS